MPPSKLPPDVLKRIKDLVSRLRIPYYDVSCGPAYCRGPSSYRQCKLVEHRLINGMAFTIPLSSWEERVQLYDKACLLPKFVDFSSEEEDPDYFLNDFSKHDNSPGEEDPNYPWEPDSNVPGEEDSNYPWDELPGEEAPNYPSPPDDSFSPPPPDDSGGGNCYGGSGLGCMPPDDEAPDDNEDPDVHSRPLSPSMGGTQEPPSKQAEQWVNWFLSQGEEGRRALGFEKGQGIPKDPTQPIDPTPFGSTRGGVGGGIPVSPVGPGVMTPVDDDNLPDSIKRRVAPLLKGIFPELDKKVPFVLSGGPQPIDPAGPGGGRPPSPRPTPRPGPVNPTIARAAPTRSKRAGASASSSPTSALQQMEDEWE